MAPGVTAHDPVTHPEHYTRGRIEVLEFIQDQRLNYTRGNVIKYVCRAGHKSGTDEIEDLRKARYCLDREIERMSRLTPRMANVWLVHSEQCVFVTDIPGPYADGILLGSYGLPETGWGYAAVATAEAEAKRYGYQVVYDSGVLEGGEESDD